MKRVVSILNLVAVFTSDGFALRDIILIFKKKKKKKKKNDEMIFNNIYYSIAPINNLRFKKSSQFNLIWSGGSGNGLQKHYNFFKARCVDKKKSFSSFGAVHLGIIFSTQTFRIFPVKCTIRR